MPKPQLTLMQGGLSKSSAPESNSGSSNFFADLYPDTHSDNLNYIRQARELLVKAVHMQFPEEKDLKEADLTLEQNLPTEYRNLPQEIWFGFRDRMRRLLLIRFDRLNGADGKPDLQHKLMVDPQVKIICN